MEYLFIAILIGLIPAVIAKGKGRSFGLWWFFGTALFIVALPASLIINADAKAVEQRKISEGMKKCPYCAEMIKREAIVCRFCGRDVPEESNTPPEAIPAIIPEIIVATSEGDFNVVHSLIQKGENINIIDGSGRTPLDIAISRKDKLLESLLVSNGAQCSSALVIIECPRCKNKMASINMNEGRHKCTQCNEEFNLEFE